MVRAREDPGVAFEATEEFEIDVALRLGHVVAEGGHGVGRGEGGAGLAQGVAGAGGDDDVLGLIRAGAERALLGAVADDLFQGGADPRQVRRQVEDFAELAVPAHQPQVFVVDADALADVIEIPVSVTEGHSRANLNRTPAESVAEIRRVAEYLAQQRQAPGGRAETRKADQCECSSTTAASSPSVSATSWPC